MAPRPAASPQAAGRGLRVAVRGASRRPGPLRPVEWAPCRRSRHLRTSAASSASGRRGEDVAKLTYFGLYALQHRGQEAAGIAVSDGPASWSTRTSAWSPRSSTSRRWPACAATSRSATPATPPPARPPGRTRSPRCAPRGRGGGRSRSATTATWSTRPSWPPGRPTARAAPTSATSDTRPGHRLLAAAARTSRSRRPRSRCCRPCSGAFSFVFMDEDTLYAARDPHGVRPLVLGRLERGWVVASETAALDIVGASFVREVEPGELIAIDDDGLRSSRFAQPEPKGCLFEYVYLARPDTTIAGRERARRPGRDRPPAGPRAPGRGRPGDPGAGVRHPGGDRLRRGSPASRTALGLVKNAYVGRTFIQPCQTIRQLGIRLKLNPLRDVLRGKRLVVVDDSIVRGNTQRALVRMLREAGALEVHVRISSPPVKLAVLLRHRLRHPGRADRQRAGRRGHPPLDRRRLARLRLAGRPGRAPASSRATRLCTACFDGDYPIPLPRRT